MAASIQSEDGDAGFQIAPMVDVVFVLLLFFMASAGMKATERELSVAVPTPTHSGVELPVIVDVSANGVVRINEQEYAAPQDRDLPRLRQWFQNAIQEFGDSPVVIRPSGDARQERVIQVLDALSSVGAKRVTFS